MKCIARSVWKPSLVIAHILEVHYEATGVLPEAILPVPKSAARPVDVDVDSSEEVGPILTPVASPQQVVETTVGRGDLQEDMQQHHLRVESRLAEEWTLYMEGFTGLTRPKDMKGEYNLWVRYNYKRVVAAIDAEDQAGLLSPTP